MKTVIATLLLIAVITFLLIAMIGRKETVHHGKFIALFFLFYFIDNLVITLTNRFPEVQLIPNHVWGGFLICSWSGKMYSVFIVLLLLHLFRPVFNDYEVGLSLHQSKGSPSLGCHHLGDSILGIFVGSKSPGSLRYTDVAIFAVMPGLNEEFVYRASCRSV
jgi:hypothetical protein